MDVRGFRLGVNRSKQKSNYKQMGWVESATNQEVQLSLTETNKLLKELIKEQKSTNVKLDRLLWFLMGLTAAAIMPIYRLLKKWDSH